MYHSLKEFTLSHSIFCFILPYPSLLYIVDRYILFYYTLLVLIQQTFRILSVLLMVDKQLLF